MCVCVYVCALDMNAVMCPTYSAKISQILSVVRRWCDVTAATNAAELQPESAAESPSCNFVRHCGVIVRSVSIKCIYALYSYTFICPVCVIHSQSYVTLKGLCVVLVCVRMALTVWILWIQCFMLWIYVYRYR